MKKRVLIFTLVAVMCVALGLAGCTSGGASASPSASAEAATSDEATKAAKFSDGGVELTVVTSYGGDDGNRPNYEAAYQQWEADTGNTVMDNSSVSNEEWKATVNTDFQTGTEPDVLFFFSGADADTIVSQGKVVSLDTIRAEYPDYGSNMNDDMLPASTADGQKYVLPVTGFWEALFCNKAVLEAAGVEVPGPGYTWDQFMADGQKIIDAGYTPVACSLAEVPHYWWEYTTFNYQLPADHLTIPANADDPAGQAWVGGLNDMTDMYNDGFFPQNTLTAGDQETFQMMADDQAAFAIDGSWKMGWFDDNVPDNLENYAVTYVPQKDQRLATDIVGGFSMGYYITTKAWDDDAKRDAAVSFVEYMTSDPVVATFSNTGVAPTALINPPVDESGATPNAFVQSAIDMFLGQTSATGAVQDLLTSDAKTELFVQPGVKDVVTGNTSAADLVNSTLQINSEGA